MDALHFVTFKTDEGFFIRFLLDTGADIPICIRNKEIK